MLTKIGATLATGALPILLWAGSAGAQQSQQSQQQPQQSQQSQQTVTTTATSLPTTTGTSGTGGTLARTGAEDLLPLAAGGVVLAGAVTVLGLRRRSLV